VGHADAVAGINSGAPLRSICLRGLNTVANVTNNKLIRSVRDLGFYFDIRVVEKWPRRQLRSLEQDALFGGIACFQLCYWRAAAMESERETDEPPESEREMLV
jgi:hypothetical protein